MLYVYIYMYEPISIRIQLLGTMRTSLSLISKVEVALLVYIAFYRIMFKTDCIRLARHVPNKTFWIEVSIVRLASNWIIPLLLAKTS